MNLFATILTHPAPSANYRGESELNRTVIQKITDGRLDYPIISPESIRNALRETLASYGLPMNRSRLHDEEQLAVRFQSYPDPDRYADDFLFGYLVAASSSDRKKILGEIKKAGRDPAVFRFKRDSVLRMNLAKALEPYRHDTVFTQSPMADPGSAYRNDNNSSLLHRETVETSFQFPFALNLHDCAKGPVEWTTALLRAIGELNGVAGNHARSYFEMAPASVVVRLSESLVAGYKTYAFVRDPASDRPGAEPRYILPELESGFLATPPDFPPSEFFIGGTVVRTMDVARRDELANLGVTLDRNAARLLQIVSDRVATTIKQSR